MSNEKQLQVFEAIYAELSKFGVIEITKDHLGATGYYDRATQMSLPKKTYDNKGVFATIDDYGRRGLAFKFHDGKEGGPVAIFFERYKLSKHDDNFVLVHNLYQQLSTPMEMLLDASKIMHGDWKALCKATGRDEDGTDNPFAHGAVDAWDAIARHASKIGIEHAKKQLRETGYIQG